MPDPPGSASSWNGLYRSGAVAAILVAVLLLGEIAVFAAFPRPESALEHFELYQRDPLVGLLTLDLLGMLAYLLFVPVVLAADHVAHQEGVLVEQREHRLAVGAARRRHAPGPGFGQVAGWSGVLAGASGIVAVILEHVSPDLVAVAIPVYFAAIVFLIAWVVLIGRGLRRTSRALRSGRADW